MELKNINSNGDDGVANNLIDQHQLYFYFLIVKIELKNKHHVLFSLNYVIIAPKKKILILFTSQINIK